MSKFVNNEFKNEIYENVIIKTFPLLRSSDSDLLLNYMENMLNVMSLTFNFDTTNYKLYVDQLKKNDYRDLVALLLLLLPFINENIENTNKKNLSSFDELFTVKNKNFDINLREPEYKYSNIQFGRCIRNSPIIERNFKKEYLDHNFYLLLGTIKLVSHKLYVNWNDILPQDIRTYKQSQLYKDTITKFNNKIITEWNEVKEFNLSNQTEIDKLKGLNINDIYNTIAGDLFYNIKDYKWIIYDIEIILNSEIKIYPMILTLNKIMNLNNCLDNFNKKNRWKNLTNEEKEKFTRDWERLIDDVYNNRDHHLTNMTISNGSLAKMLISLLFMFDKSYINREKAIAEKKYVEFADKNNPGRIYNITDSEIKKSIYSLHAEHMYEYISWSIQKFKHTWYAETLLISNDQNRSKKIQDIEKYRDLKTTISRTFNIPVVLTLKNIYNYSKSFTRRNNIEMPEFFISLNKFQKKIIENRLNNRIPDFMSWFNIANYIRKTYSILNLENDNQVRKLKIYEINKTIHNMIRENIIDYIFEIMIKKGILSIYKPNLKSNKVVLESIKKSELMSNSYYYLTGEPYSKLNPFVFREKNYSNFWDFLNDSDWHTLYALDWISQINFFHRYINNRIIYVTGAPGVGKSTQIPKLLLYALKSVDYNNFGSVVCTEPRIGPTKENAQTISGELGVPVEHEDYVQYKYKGSTKPTTRVEHLLLRIVTDGYFLQTIKNPLLKKSLEIDSNIYYKPNNSYDIIIVDEAHEHNKNMDLILTLMRHVTYYNNSIRLVIISATMDPDEFRYRRYYRDINDNRLLPFNLMLKEENLDRINVDRRIHISAPGTTSRYVIKDNFLPNINDIELIKSIISSSSDGNILYFLPGKPEIDKKIEELNKILPPNILAVPLHSKISTFQRKLIQNLHNDIYNIKTNRFVSFYDLTEENIGKGTSSYNRAIIVSTNIAEASITLQGLKYVIDTGTQKVLIYDPKKNVSSIVLKPITEASRLQRRGRVGRRGSGEVFYLYPLEMTLNEIHQYDISISNIYLELYDRLADSNQNIDMIKIFDENNDPNFVLSTNNLNNINTFNLKKLYKIPGLPDIIYNQYFLNDKFYKYFGNSDHYDYNKNKLLPPMYKTGFSIMTLTDSDGSFYIIHPEELYLIRNIVGKITNLKTKTNNIKFLDGKIESFKINQFWRILLDFLFLSIRHNNNMLFFKTELGKNIVALKQKFADLSEKDEEFSINFLLTILYGISLGIKDKIIKIIAFYSLGLGDISKKLIKPIDINSKNKYMDLQNAHKNLGTYFGSNIRSEYEAILHLVNDFHDSLNNQNVIIDPNAPIYKLIIAKLISNQNVTKNKYFNVYSKIQEDIKNKEINQEFNDEEYNKIRKKSYIYNIIRDSIPSSFIENWSNHRSLNYVTIEAYFRKYIRFMSVIDWDNDPLIKNSTKLISKTLYDTKFETELNNKIMLAFMYGYRYQIIRNIENIFYISIYDMTMENIFMIDRMLVNKMYLSKYCIYLNYDAESNIISNLQYFDINKLKFIGFVYSQDTMYSKTLNFLNESISVLNENNIFKIDQIIVAKYKNVVQNILKDILETHDIAIWDSIEVIFIDKEYIMIRKYHDKNYLTVKNFIILNDFTYFQSGGFLKNSPFYVNNMTLVKYIYNKNIKSNNMLKL